MIKKFEQYNEAKENNLDIDVTDINQEFIDDLIYKLSFVYKKNKDRHVRPIDIKGKTQPKDIDLNIKLSNKDKIHFVFKDDNEIKITINDELLFHMDEFDKDSILNKLYKVYTEFLKTNKYKISKKDNPFESLDLSLLEDKKEQLKNPLTLKRDGREFWIGVFDMVDGEIYDVYTEEVASAADYHPDFYVSDELLTKIDHLDAEMFWMNGDGEIDSTWDLLEDNNEQDTELKKYLTNKILEQITIRCEAAYKDLYKNNRLVYENNQEKNPMILNRNKKEFYAGVYDLESGYIYEVYTEAEAEDAIYDPDYYVKIELLYKMDKGEAELFFYNSQTKEIESMWGLLDIYDEDDKVLIDKLNKNIKNQITIKSNHYKDLYDNKKLVYESLLDELKGPSIEEIWKNLGYDKSFNTPEEFFLGIIEVMTNYFQDKYTSKWKINGKQIFEQDFTHHRLYVDENSVWKIFENIFNMKYSEIEEFIKKMIKKHLNWKNFKPTCWNWDINP